MGTGWLSTYVNLLEYFSVEVFLCTDVCESRILWVDKQYYYISTTILLFGSFCPTVWWTLLLMVKHWHQKLTRKQKHTDSKTMTGKDGKAPNGALTTILINAVR